LASPFVALVKPKAVAKDEPLFNKLASAYQNFDKN
jgi:hypothetical protein